MDRGRPGGDRRRFLLFCSTQVRDSFTIRATMKQRSLPVARRVRLRVLVADDAVMNRSLASRLLEEEGHVVSVATNGEHAISELQDRKFDLVLMDVEMPVMNGIEATRAIRAREQSTGSRIPIIALTSTKCRDECLAAGMDAFLSKPLKVGELRRVLKSMFGERAA